VKNGFVRIRLFGYPNTVCKPTPPECGYTVERLKERFPHYNK